MREAIGSQFILRLMIIFIFFFSAFLAITISYSQAFRLKNQIINDLEQYEGYNDESIEHMLEAADDYGYNREKNCVDGAITPTVKTGANEGEKVVGVCIKGLKTGRNNESRYYQVETYVNFDLPLIGTLLAVPVKGETKIITNPVDIEWH